MSYILSALRKAERERRQGFPDLWTENETVSVSSGDSSHHKAYLLGFGIVILIMGNLWIYHWMDKGQISNIQAPVSTLNSEADEQTQIPRTPLPAVTSVPAEQRPVEQQLNTPSVPSVMEDFPTRAALPSGQVLEFSELSAGMQAQMPPLQLTGHLYSLGHARARKVIIDGKALREQQYINEGLFVKEITPDGAVLNFRGQLFRLSATQMFQ